MKNNKTVWDRLVGNSSRRASMSRDVYYIKTMDGYPCIGIKGNFNSLKEIERLKFEKLSIKGNKDNIYLIYGDIKNVKIFEYICKDIIESLEQNTSNLLIKVLVKRLLDWKMIFDESNIKNMSENLQMGLFTELSFLKKQIIKLGDISLVINSWMGPEKLKQDFIFKDNATEVKSYKTSRGKSVVISSVEQLYYPNGKLYLACYGLSKSDIGETIKTIFDEVDKIIGDENIELRDIFRLKVLKYGFLYYKKNEFDLSKFIVDREEIYLVDESFPKVNPIDIMEGIENISYKVNLSKCKENLIKKF